MKIEIEFGKLYNGATFIDPKTERKWVKFDEDGAVRESDPYDTVGYFGKEEIVIVE